MYNSIIAESELMDNDIVFTNLMESVGLSTEVIYEAFDIRGFINRIKEMFKKMLEAIKSFFLKRKANMNSTCESLSKLYRDNYDTIKKNYNSEWSIQGYTYDNFDEVASNIYKVFQNQQNILTAKKIENDIASGKYIRNNDNNVNTLNEDLLNAINRAIGSEKGGYNNISEMIKDIYINARSSESPRNISKRSIFLDNIEEIINPGYKPRDILGYLSTNIQTQIQEDLKYIERLERTLSNNDTDVESKRAYFQLGIKCITFQKTVVQRIIEAIANLCNEELNQTRHIIEILAGKKSAQSAKHEMGIFSECSFI